MCVLFFRFFSLIGYYKILSLVPCIIQQVLVCCLFYIYYFISSSMYGGSDSKESACNSGDLGSIPGLGWSLEEGTATHSGILA